MPAVWGQLQLGDLLGQLVRRDGSRSDAVAVGSLDAKVHQTDEHRV